MTIDFPLRPHLKTFGQRIKMSPATGQDFELKGIIDRGTVEASYTETQSITVLVHQDDLTNRGIVERDGVTLYDVVESGEDFIIRNIDLDDAPAVNIELSRS